MDLNPDLWFTESRHETLYATIATRVNDEEARTVRGEKTTVRPRRREGERWNARGSRRRSCRRWKITHPATAGAQHLLYIPWLSTYVSTYTHHRRSTICENRSIDDLEAHLRTRGACDNRFPGARSPYAPRNNCVARDNYSFHRLWTRHSLCNTYILW